MLSTKRVDQTLRSMYYRMAKRFEGYGRYSIFVGSIRNYITMYRYYQETGETPPRPLTPLDEIDIANTVIHHALTMQAAPIELLNSVAHLVAVVFEHNSPADLKHIRDFGLFLSKISRSRNGAQKPCRGVKALVCSLVHVIEHEDDIVSYEYTRELTELEFKALMRVVALIPYNPKTDAVYKDAVSLIFDDVVRRYRGNLEIPQNAYNAMEKLKLGSKQAFVSYMRQYNRMYEFPSIS